MERLTEQNVQKFMDQVRRFLTGYTCTAASSSRTGFGGLRLAEVSLTDVADGRSVEIVFTNGYIVSLPLWEPHEGTVEFDFSAAAAMLELTIAQAGARQSFIYQVARA